MATEKQNLHPGMCWSTPSSQSSKSMEVIDRSRLPAIISRYKLPELFGVIAQWKLKSPLKPLTPSSLEIVTYIRSSSWTSSPDVSEWINLSEAEQNRHQAQETNTVLVWTGTPQQSFMLWQQQQYNNHHFYYIHLFIGIVSLPFMCPCFCLFVCLLVPLPNHLINTRFYEIFRKYRVDIYNRWLLASVWFKMAAAAKPLSKHRKSDNS